MQDLSTRGTNCRALAQLATYLRRYMAAETSAKRRVKAAMVLANLDLKELAEKIGTRGLAARTLRKLQDENDPREPRPWELELIAQACGVPEWFLERGWAGAPASEDDRLAQLEEAQRLLDARLLVLEEEANQRTAGKGPATAGRSR